MAALGRMNGTGEEMALKDSLPAFRELRDFAMEEIPRSLRENGGRLSKSALHRVVERRFTQARGGWPEELEGLGSTGCRRATNAVAWALATLTSQAAIEPCAGLDVVRLR